MSRKRCAIRWPGDLWHCEHTCARPPGHPGPCMCYCGERPRAALPAPRLEVLRARFAAAAKSGEIKLLDPLPRRALLRLWFDQQVNGAGIWLAAHGRYRAAEHLWRACGRW